MTVVIACTQRGIFQRNNYWNNSLRFVPTVLILARMNRKPISRVLLDREDAQAILGPYHEKLVSISTAGFHQGWLGHQAARPAEHPIFTPRTSANYIYDYTTYIARQQFAGDPTVEIIKEEEAWYFKFHDRLLVQFKRLNAYGCPSSNDTNHGMISSNQTDLWRGDATGPFHPTYVVVGHVLDPSKVKVTDVLAVCMRDDDKWWNYSLMEATAVQPEEIPSRAPDERRTNLVAKKRKRKED